MIDRVSIERSAHDLVHDAVRRGTPPGAAAEPVVLWADDAHHLDAATLTLLRRLVWASRSLPLAVVITTRPDPSRESLAMLTRQAQARLSLPLGTAIPVVIILYMLKFSESYPKRVTAQTSGQQPASSSTPTSA